MPIFRKYSCFSGNVIAEMDKDPLPCISGEPALTGLSVPSRFNLCTSFNAACRLWAKKGIFFCVLRLKIVYTTINLNNFTYYIVKLNSTKVIIYLILFYLINMKSMQNSS